MGGVRIGGFGWEDGSSCAVNVCPCPCALLSWKTHRSDYGLCAPSEIEVQRGTG